MLVTLRDLSVNNCTHFICSFHLLATIVKAVRKANKEMNRRGRLCTLPYYRNRILKKGNLL